MGYNVSGGGSIIQVDTGLKRKVMKVEDRMNRELISGRLRKPMITIIDDDGRTDFLTKWEPILQEKSFKISIAVITGWVGNSGYMTWDDLERLKRNYDVDLVNHTHTHRYLADLDESEVRWELENSTKILKERGHSYDVLVYPYGSNNSTVRNILREYCRVGINISGGVATPPLETFRLNRQGLIPQTGTMEPVETYTAYIDEAIANNGWIIWMTHSQYAPFDGDKIKAIIDYANSAGIEWVHVHEGLARIGNLIDVGDYPARAQGAEYTILDADGILHSRTNSKDYYFPPSGSMTTVADSPITDWKTRTTTIKEVTSSSASGFPENKAGVLETVRGSNDSFSYQTYKIYNSNVTYRRRWNTTTNAWEPWQRIDAARLQDRVTQTVAGEVPANGILNVTLTVPGVTNDDNVIGTPRAGLESGLMYAVFINTTDQIRVRLWNTTDSPISTSRTWKFDIIKSS